MRWSSRLFAASILCSAAVSTVLAELPTSPGGLTVTGQDGGVVDLPLRHTKVSIEVTAFVARTTVEQTFGNPYGTPIDAVYTFPLGDRAAVDDFELTVGDRTIRGEIQRSEEARQTYERARASGYRAALLEQQRPNIFTQSVANLEPGKTVVVRLRTVETLRYERGVYQVAFPLVVAPRYTRGGSSAGAAACVPVLPPESRSGHDVEIDATIDAGVPLHDLRSASHRVVIDHAGGTSAHVRLAEDDRIPNKDFLLQWSVASDRPAVGFMAHRSGLDGFFTLLVQPKAEIEARDAAPKEITLVVDTSGSMSGTPLDASKRFIARVLHALGPRDTFNIVRFSGDNEVFSRDPLPNDPEAIDRAIAWVNAAEGGGGTEMLAAMRAAFARPVDPNRLRIVVFLTDGEVGEDEEILRDISKVLGEARIYTVGIGTSVNRYLLDRMADLGRGAFIAIRPDETADDALEAFRSWVALPYLTDLTVDWGALPVADVAPDPIRDLGSGQTLALVGRYLQAAEGDVVVRGKLGGHYWEHRIHVALPDSETRHAPLAALWARGRIENLLRPAPGAAPDAVRAEVTSLAIDFRLLSPFTSFVAVDDSTVVNAAGTAPVVRQAVPLPEGISFEGVFGAKGPPAFAVSGGGGRPEDPGAAEGSTLNSGGLRIRVIDNSDKSEVIGAFVTLDSTSKLVAKTTTATDVNGTALFPVLRAGGGYVITVIMDGYSGMRQEVTVVNAQTKDVLFALAPEHVELVKVMADNSATVDLDQSQTSTKFSGEFIADLPVAGRFAQNVLALAPGVQDPDGDGNPNVDGARERDFRTQVAGVGNVDPLTGTFLNLVASDSIEDLTTVTAGAGAEFGRAQGGFAQIIQKQGSNDFEDLSEDGSQLRQDAFRVLADLADDGRLSPADGKPALAALLAAQNRSGAVARDTVTNAIATWAFAEAERALPAEPWIASARAKAVRQLAAIALAEGWPARPGGTLDHDATAWATFVLAILRPEAARTAHGNSHAIPAELGRIEAAAARPKDGTRPLVSTGRAPLERLIAAIDRGHLMI